VTPITTATNTAVPPITVGSDPRGIAITPNGKTAYVTNESSDTVTPIATATNTAGPPISVGLFPWAIAITPDGTTAYVANYGSGTVTPVTIATNTAGPPITVGNEPFAIAITPPSGGPAFTSASSDTVAFGRAFSFTVTTTGSPVPKIVRTGRLPGGVTFTKNGDGTGTLSGTPAGSAAGDFPMTLTATNKSATITQAFTLTVTRAPAVKKIPDGDGGGQRTESGCLGHGIPSPGLHRNRPAARRSEPGRPQRRDRSDHRDTPRGQRRQLPDHGHSDQRLRDG
jgi:YVTN family beta-propeller protein